MNRIEINSTPVAKEALTVELKTMLKLSSPTKSWHSGPNGRGNVDCNSNRFNIELGSEIFGLLLGRDGEESLRAIVLNDLDCNTTGT